MISNSLLGKTTRRRKPPQDSSGCVLFLSIKNTNEDIMRAIQLLQ